MSTFRKPRIASLLIATALTCLSFRSAHAQCANDNTLTGATVTPPCPGSTTVPCLQGGQYALVNVIAGNQYTFSTCGATWDTQITLYNNSGGGSLGYNDDFCGLQSTVSWTASFTGQLRVLVDRYVCTNNAVCAPLTITCAAGPPPLTNNDPCGAIPVSVTSQCAFTTYTNVGASNSTTTPTPACGLFWAGSQDVWFSFVAPPTGIAIIETQAGTMTDGAMALYADAPPPGCAGPFTLVQCDDDSGPGLMPFLSFTGLNPGWTYYLRVWGYFSNTGTFGLCVHGPSSVPAGACVYALQLFDNFGDGWGTSSVGVSINGGPYTDYTLGGQYNVVLIGLNVGDVIVLNYNASGPNQGQNSYRLSFLTGNTLIFTSGPPPTAGVSFSQTVTCITPAPPATDCIGGATICSGQSFNNNSNNTGNVVDLTAANQGCLASGERQGTWYIFSPSAPGTIGFTIAPAAPTDYDFAVWGPYPPGATTGSVCPPPGPPLRCSYSALYTNTGLGNGAADLTEGAGGDAWVSTINVTVGQVFLLYVDNFSINGQSFALTWQLSNGASLDCTVLPMELISFDAQPGERDVQLLWVTASEQDNDVFLVERSKDGSLFSPIGTVEGAGTTVEETHYLHLDGSPENGMNYYRLKQVDLDGHFSYSDVRNAFFHRENGPLTLVPNPGSDAVRVVLPRSASTAIVQVVDATGRSVLSMPASGNQVVLDTSVLRNGLYSVQAVTKDGVLISSSTWVKE
jgi:hypothetical protein